MAKRLRVLVLHGPNLNLLGRREPDVYGQRTLAEIDARLAEVAREADAELRTHQSNHEGELIERIHEAIGWADGIVVNPAGLTHTSVALRDALTAAGVPVVEVHLSNVYAREPFRHHSFVSGIALGVVSGFGPLAYELGLRALIEHLRS